MDNDLAHGQAAAPSAPPDALHTLAETVRRERPRLLDFIRRRVKTEEDAEDILQDIFYGLASSYSVTEPIERLTAWLFRAARNRIIDWYRKKRPDLSLDENGDEAPFEGFADDPGQEPDMLFERSRVWDELADALEELPEEQRNVFVQHELEGKSFKEIAESSGEPLNTLLSRKRYAVLYLRERLQGLYDDFLS